MSISIENKVALVTGANRGIGKAIVDTFISHGAKKIYLAVRDPESTKALEEKYGDKVVTVQAEVSDRQTIEELARQATDVEVLVNKAGSSRNASPLSDKAEEALQQELQVNLFGLLAIAQAFAGTLEKNQGVLVQLNSVASIKNFVPLSTYSASKAASYSLTQGLRDVFAEKGVSVLSVHPGPIDTDMAASAGFEGAPAATVVSEGIVNALQAGHFHLFPDEMAKQFESAYQSFSDNMITAVSEQEA